MCAIRHLDGLSELCLNSNPLVSDSERLVAMGPWSWLLTVSDIVIAIFKEQR
jgi:hypothetical protein